MQLKIIPSDYFKSGIYKIANLITNDSYIGKASKFLKRYGSHLETAARQNDKRPLYANIEQYGIENFSFEILEICDDTEQNEKFFINKFQPSLNVNFTVEFQNRASKHSKHMKDYWSKNPHPRRGIKLTPEQISTLKEAQNNFRLSIQKDTEDYYNKMGCKLLYVYDVNCNEKKYRGMKDLQNDMPISNSGIQTSLRLKKPVKGILISHVPLNMEEINNCFK